MKRAISPGCPVKGASPSRIPSPERRTTLAGLVGFIGEQPRYQKNDSYRRYKEEDEIVREDNARIDLSWYSGRRGLAQISNRKTPELE